MGACNLQFLQDRVRSIGFYPCHGHFARKAAWRETNRAIKGTPFVVFVFKMYYTFLAFWTLVTFLMS